MADSLIPLDAALGLVAAMATAGLVLLLFLYLSLRRDVVRLRGLRERDPLHAQIDFETSERLLDRAELELEQLYRDRGEPVPGTTEFAAVHATEVHPGPLTGTHPVTGEDLTGDHPALDQLTMERSARIPHPRWRRFVRAITRPRWLILIGLGALLIGVGAIFAVDRLLQQEQGGPVTTAPAIDPATVDVVVLNGTEDAGLGGQASPYISAAGFNVTEVGVISGKHPETSVEFAIGQREAASEVAHELGVDSSSIREIRPEVERLAPQADVVVIVGEDREL